MIKHIVRMSIPLDGGISFTEICGVIDESYELVK